METYCEVNRQLKDRGYTGIYVVYDEFGKYLETSISQTSESDMKLLQDFAEKCNRRDEMQLHLEEAFSEHIIEKERSYNKQKAYTHKMDTDW